MSELTDLIAKVKAGDAADFEREMAKHGPEALDAATLHACKWCKFTWSTVYGTRPRPTIWIPEIQGYAHLRCYQKFKEGTL